MKDSVESAIMASLKHLGIEAPPHIEIEVSKEETFGDMSSPVAMALAKALKRPPRKIAEDIITNMPDEKIFEKVEVAGQGFMNFTFKADFLYAELKRFLMEREKFLRQDIGKGKKILIEFVSANPTGPLHLGHGRGAAVGGALSNLLEAAGYDVKREYYINDAGKQVRLLGMSVFARYQQLLGIEYEFPEEGYMGGYVEDIANAVIKEEGSRYAQSDFNDAGRFFTDFSYKVMLSEIREDLERFGISFDIWQSERQLYEDGDVERAIEYLRGKGHLYEKEGALWFKATRFGDEKDRVIVKKDGEYTYFASDIAYHRKKIEGGYDELINIWGADHHGYIPRLRCVIEALGFEREKLRVLLVQMVALLRAGHPVQMSKRAGEFVALREVMDEVGADTTKFIFLTRRPDSHLEFDLEAAKATSAENPVYYVQYANARINSIFKHAEEKGFSIEKPGRADLRLLIEKDEIRLIKKILLYTLVFDSAVRAHEPHRITYYLQELSGIFHAYYNRHKVVADEPALADARLALSEAVRVVLREGLGILGLTAPERM